MFLAFFRCPNIRCCSGQETPTPSPSLPLPALFPLFPSTFCHLPIHFHRVLLRRHATYQVPSTSLSLPPSSLPFPPPSSSANNSWFSLARTNSVSQPVCEFPLPAHAFHSRQATRQSHQKRSSFPPRARAWPADSPLSVASAPQNPKTRSTARFASRDFLPRLPHDNTGFSHKKTHPRSRKSITTASSSLFSSTSRSPCSSQFVSRTDPISRLATPPLSQTHRQCTLLFMYQLDQRTVSRPFFKLQLFRIPRKPSSPDICSHG